MNPLIPVILQLAGVGIIIAEIIIPSGGILSILAVGVFAYSLYLVFTNISIAAGAVLLIVDLVTIPVLIIIGIKFLARSSFVTLRQTLSREQGVTSQSEDMDQYKGVEGLALTDLRPAGMALLNDRRTDVVTRGEYLDKGTPVVVIKITGNQIVVKRQTQTHT
ncbi:MAG: NfeD family protein [Desulfobacterales bacterium]